MSRPNAFAFRPLLRLSQLHLVAALGCALAIAAPVTHAAAETTVRRSDYPDNIDILVNGQPLLERVGLEAKRRGRDMPEACAWRLKTLRRSEAGDVVTIGCRAEAVRGQLEIIQAAPGTIVLVADLGREMPLAAEGGLRLTGAVAGFERGTAWARCEPWWMRPAFFSQQNFLPGETQLVLVKRAQDAVSLLPLAGGGATGWVRGANLPISGGGMTVALEARAPWSARRVPIAAISVAGSPYEATAAAYRHGLAVMGAPARLRADKHFPEAFDRLGFCTWNSLYEEQTSARLRSLAEALHAAPFPLGFLIIDAGWQDATQGSNIFWHRLRSFRADPKKIPEGLAKLVKDLRSLSGAQHIGVWHALQGTPGGVAPHSPLATAEVAHLWKGRLGGLIPDPTSDAGADFYRTFYRTLAESDVDLVKVDFQNWNEMHVAGRAPVHAALQQSVRNLQTATREAFGGNVIGCMSLGDDVLFGLSDLSVVRSSLDYLLPPGPLGHRRHVLNNVFNSLPVQQIAWPDFDMWEAYGDFAVWHSVLRALGGGPIYLTGDASREDWTLVRRLTLSDGTLLHVDQPVLPTRDCLFVDASQVPVPLKGFATAGQMGLVGAFNVLESGGSVTGALRPSDVEGLEGERFAVLEYFSRHVTVLARNESLAFSLAPDETRLDLIAPLEREAAAFGLIDKYVAPGTIKSLQDDGRTMSVDVVEGGSLGAYLPAPPRRVTLDGSPVEARWNEGLLVVPIADVPSGSHSVTITR